ncbi:hypothetical protein L0B70_01990 [Kaistella sp. 97-N-M2]|uniref:hypothetical protein n=1 Tax=Kaistella sp. 97-N-M2 TaxID=2908645 RepID=UPI001F29A3AB|nr:hypothetical protein [Kaistella sp. 97-N-M2]UJF30192.1 hypothetical protein L0B70_01990 [Kaistella sp. 97-N-M2]
MLLGKKIRKILAAFFAGVYLFVALFSQNFHDHGSGEVFKDFHFKKSEKTYSTNHSAENYSDCLSCHILHAGSSLVPQDFQFSFVAIDDFQKQVFAYEQRFATCEQLFTQLRGPPVNFI